MQHIETGSRPADCILAPPCSTIIISGYHFLQVRIAGDGCRKLNAVQKRVVASLAAEDRHRMPCVPDEDNPSLDTSSDILYSDANAAADPVKDGMLLDSFGINVAGPRVCELIQSQVIQQRLWKLTGLIFGQPS